MNKVILLIMYVLLFISCSDKKYQQKIESFVEEKTLSAEKIRVDDVIFPGWIMLKAHNLFVIDVKNDTMLYQYALPGFDCIYKGGVRGQADDEFQAMPRFCRTLSEKVYLWGYTPFSIRSFSLDSLGGWIREKEYILPVSEGVANERHIVGDSILIYNAAPGNLSVRKVNLNNPDDKREIQFEPDEHQESFFYRNRGYVTANDSLIIYVYAYKKQIDIYNMVDCSLKKRLVNNDVVPHIEVGNLENSVFCHLGVVACKKYFYVRCRETDDRETLEVYDYSGHSVAKYDFDIPPLYFDVDEENKVIYGYHFDYEDYFLKYTYGD